ncbi:MAG TPA: transcription antitermination factor NusB [Stackebrandtia sp.]|nr:transcription antitermination factor NusB [Stackebrandtia sp.]HZE37290.1 transcription antitermination factor NusB [Stackebrandtia sp.]
MSPAARPRRSTVDAARRAAYQAIAAVTADDAYVNLVLPKLLARQGIDGRDAAFATELAYGTCRYRGTLDAIIGAAARRDPAGLDAPVRDVLRLAAYQLLLTRVAPHAAVDTAVSLARAEAGHRTAGFVNAVSRAVGRKTFDAWIAALSTGDEVGDLALRHAHPKWMAAALLEALGDTDELAAALEADNRAPAVHLCARPGLIDRDDLAARVDGHDGRWSPQAVYLPGGDPGDLDPLRRGLAHVQDEGSQLVALALANAPVDGDDSRWLDLCAGPGGKTALLGSIAAQRNARVTAVEVAEHRARLVDKATRGLPVEVLAADGRTFDPGVGFDRVLVDAPCSGVGALRRRPEARWRKRPSDVDELVVLQRELLGAALRLVRPGGVVAYVTCSPLLPETRDIVAAADAEPIDATALFPAEMALGTGPTVQLWPHRHGTDAMFCALLRRS